MTHQTLPPGGLLPVITVAMRNYALSQLYTLIFLTGIGDSGIIRI